MLTLFFSLLCIHKPFGCSSPRRLLDSQVGLGTSSLISFSSPDDVGLSGNVDELAEGKQRSFFFNNANPEPFLISDGDNSCSRPNGNQIPNSKRRSKRQSSEICPFNSFVRSGPNNKPKTFPSTSTSGQEGDMEQLSTQPDSKPVPVTQPVQARNNCDDNVINIPIYGSLRNVYFNRAVGPWTLLICHLCK